MAGLCIPAYPDISGIGVRTAIYAQNLLCFAPVVSYLWDGKISTDEMSGVKDQSIGMLANAFLDHHPSHVWPVDHQIPRCCRSPAKLDEQHQHVHLVPALCPPSK
jgi:hypothetical protein